MVSDKLSNRTGLLSMVLISSSILFVSICQTVAGSPITSYTSSFGSEDNTALLLVAFAIVSAMFLTWFVISIGRNRVSSEDFVLAALLCIFSGSSILFITLPLVNGYQMYGRGDVLTHLGNVSHILYYGRLDSNFYPAVHLLAALTSHTTGVDANVVCMLVPTILMTATWCAAALVGRSIGLSWRAITCIIVSIPPFLLLEYATGIYPAGLAFPVMMLAVFLVFRLATAKSDYAKWTLLLVLVGVFSSIVHPSLPLICVLTILSISHLVNRNMNFGVRSPDVFIRCVRMTSVITIVMFVLWMSQFTVLDRLTSQFIQYLSGDYSSAYSDLALSKATSLNISEIELLSLLFKLFGGVAIYILYAFGLWIVIRLRTPADCQVFSDARLTSLFQLNLMLVSVITLLFFGVFLNLTPFRILPYALLISAVVQSIAVIHIIRPDFGIGFSVKMTYRRFKGLTWITPILIAATLGLIGLYPMPYSCQMNVGITQSEISSMAWCFEHETSEDGMLFVGYGISPDRFYDAMVFFAPSIHTSVDRPSSGLRVPYHFGYDVYADVTQSIQPGSLVVLSKYDYLAYTAIWSSADMFNSSDFSSFKADTHVNHVFSSSDMDLYYVI